MNDVKKIHHLMLNLIDFFLFDFIISFKRIGVLVDWCIYTNHTNPQ